MIRYLRLLLLPFSVLYGIIVLIRNKLYDAGVFKQTSFDLPVICVGNLVVGGSGKSPVTEYLINLLAGKRIAVLSRGYGRNSKGYIVADQAATSMTIGDEPMQFYRKFPNITVAVCEDRVKGINRLKETHDLIILDDAFQHRSVKPGFSILLFEFQKLQHPQFLLPAGNLRESFSGYHRAQALLVTKAPQGITEMQRSACAAKFDTDSANRLSFSYLTYHDLVHLTLSEKRSCSSISVCTSVFLLTGIANPLPLVSYLKQYTQLIFHHNYPDHYRFSVQNISLLVSAFNKNPSQDKIIITTEKDAQRLLDNTLKELLLNLPVYYLPVKIALTDEDRITFDNKIIEYVSSTTRNR
ncbi:tetraacyldisaccharide 4'-kinase [Pedobacter psychroterrae]|uniref:Tetraacyldisaccharide 4'-kinase n=1 Tax=Pedobacter psychroterrae TaxID=2530453 RepID=A0A4R0NRC9_9SPHI|nr:tetraacyldisaccharide 4'-kinase [Pedobacter psychroterrae]TCD03682.1 tetraacyldisaccharide 4'-kinase [Pedobacter psychroterrae]